MRYLFHTQGKITKVMTASQEDAALNMAEGETMVAIDADVDPDTHYFKHGQIVPLPPKPGEWAVFDCAREEWTDPRTQADIDRILMTWRASATLPRAQFCIALKRAGLLTAEQAEQAAQGFAPAPLLDAINILPETDREDARILWAGLAQVERMHPLVALVAWAQDVSDATVDAIFGPEI